jgi:TPR repeat protein
MKRIVAILALLFWLQPAQAGELAQGLSAYRAGNYGEAVALFRPLAQQGDPWAQYSLAVAYDDGLGVPRNFKLALEWYRRAGYQGLADAQYMTGRFYGNGRGVRQDPAKAGLPAGAAAARPALQPAQGSGAVARVGGGHRMAGAPPAADELQVQELHLSEMDQEADVVQHWR